MKGVFTGTSLAVVAALLSMLTYLLIASRGPNQPRLAAMERSLQALQLHDAEINRDVLLVRAGLLAHYDSLALTSRRLTHDLDALRAEGSGLRDRLASEIAPRVDALAAATREKLISVEYVKSDCALLRNSIAYLAQSADPHTARRLLDPIPRDRGRSANTPPDHTRPDHALDATLAARTADVAGVSFALLRFVQTPHPGARDDAVRALDRLSPESPGDVGDREVGLLGAHGRLVLALVPQIDGLLAEIVGASTARHAEALQQALSAYAHRAQARAQRFRLLLYVVALVLLAYLLSQLARLRTRTRELRRKEMQLIQANKMTALGTLVSGVAHEINNPNQIVLMNSDVLATAWADATGILDSHTEAGERFSLGGLPYEEMRETVSRLVAELRDGARRIDRLIADLKDFARPRAGVSEPFQLNDAVRRALRLLAHVVHRRTDRLLVDLRAGLPLVKGDAQQMEQVVVNLAINALESLPDRRHAVAVTTSFDPRDRSVALDISDEGIGIPAEHLSRLGEPFFTTKDASGGTGLGLAITSSLVRLHGGRLRFTSEPGKGTTVQVLLPCAEP